MISIWWFRYLRSKIFYLGPGKYCTSRVAKSSYWHQNQQNCIYYKNRVKWPEINWERKFTDSAVFLPVYHFTSYSLLLYSKRFEVRHQRPFSINKWSLHSQMLKLCHLKMRYSESFYFFIQLNIIPIFMFSIVFNGVVLVKLEIVKCILIRVILFSKCFKTVCIFEYEIEKIYAETHC